MDRTPGKSKPHIKSDVHGHARGSDVHGHARGKTASAKEKKPVRHGHHAGCNRIFTADETEFIMAIDAWKCRTGVQFPMWSEVLAILLSLGYRKTKP